MILFYFIFLYFYILKFNKLENIKNRNIQILYLFVHMCSSFFFSLGYDVEKILDHFLIYCYYRVYVFQLR